MNVVQFTLQAEADLESIEEYIARDNPDAASRMVIRLRDACRLLRTQPQAGEDRSDLRPNLRGFPVGNYLIFYRASQHGIQVLRILHGARDLPPLFEGDV